MVEMINNEPATLAADLEQISQRVPSNVAAKTRISESDYEHQHRLRTAFRAWCRVAQIVGKRYLHVVCNEQGEPCGVAGVSLDNYQADTAAQKATIQTLRDFVASIHERMENGDGLLLCGPKGTGKDHLALACLRYAAEAGYVTFTADGQSLFQVFRDVIGSDASEREHIARYTAPDVLLLSDPIPVAGSTSDYQRSVLWRIIDRRYRDKKPTWVTMNVADGKEADMKLGGQIMDRLRDGATAVICEWPSYRRVAK